MNLQIHKRTNKYKLEGKRRLTFAFKYAKYIWASCATTANRNLAEDRLLYGTGSTQSIEAYKRRLVGGAKEIDLAYDSFIKQQVDLIIQKLENELTL